MTYLCSYTILLWIRLMLLEMRRSKRIIVVPLFKSHKTLSESKQRDEDRYLQLLNLGFSEHNFFYSFTSDITLTQQAVTKIQQNKHQHDTIWIRADHRFFWNRELVLDLITNTLDDWIVPFMSAYVEVRTDCVVEDMKFTLLFISRRSRYRQGCRFIKRGIDSNGHPANFVETEQILLLSDGRLSSYVQIRGSIPLKWSSPVHMKYEPVVFIDDNKEQSMEWSLKHLKELSCEYCDASNASNILCINLVDNKKDQGRLGVVYKEMIDSNRIKLTPSPLTYVWFDFHHECKQKGKWNNLGKLVSQVDDIFRSQKFFSKSSTGQVTSWQVGVIRTNCMDNLDRTNVVQSLFARRSIVFQLDKADKVDLNSPTGLMTTPWKNFEVMFKHVWANNANAISLGYAGTGALKVDFTKTGKRTVKGMFNDGVNSIKRYYINNFTDGIKQDAIDIMLGNYKPEISSPSPFGRKASQEGLSTNITKLFAVLLFTFVSLLLFVPFIGLLYEIEPREDVLTATTATLVVDRNVNYLRKLLLISLGFTLLVGMYYSFKIIKKGSVLGAKVVIHPELCPESLPDDR